MIRSRITINGHDYESPDQMPPDVRRQYDEAMRRMSSALATGATGEATRIEGGARNLGQPSTVVIRKTITTVNVGGADLRPPGQIGTAPSPESFLFEPSDVRSRARDFFWGLVWWVAIALVLWIFLGRW